jgi:TRAP-type mannitol/chloroaromatic compound transport system permease small subunit
MKTLLGKANRAAELLSGKASLAAGIGLFIMMLVGAADIAAGKLLGIPVPGAFEATEALLAATALLPLAYNRTTRTQIKVNFIFQRLPASAQRKLRAAGDLVCALFFGILAWQGWIFAFKSLAILEYQAGIVGFPVYPAKILLAVALSLMAATCLVRSLAPWFEPVVRR